MSRHPADPRKQPKQARSRATVDRILEGAARVLAEEGYAATTDRIAAAAHVSVGSLYQYFPHKDAMILALATRHLELSRETLSRPLAAGGPATRWIPAIVAAMADLHRDAPLHRLLYDQTPRTPALVAAFGEVEQGAITAMASLITDEHDASPDAAQLVARMLATLIEGSIHRLADEMPGPTLQAEVTRAALAYLESAMSAR